MNTLNSLLITQPTVHVVAHVGFDNAGLGSWIEFKGLDQSELYQGSPIQKIQDGSNIIAGADQAEIVAELAGRACYGSYLKGRSSGEFIANVVEMEHGSVLEHVNYTFVIEGVSRSLTHELIRHRAGAAVSQESQRYVDAADIRFIVPPLLLDQCNGDLNHERIQTFAARCERALGDYKEEQAAYVAELEALPADDVKSRTVIKKRANEAARSLLPNCAETKLTWTGNLRTLRHVVALRGDEHADLEIRRLATVLAEIMIERAPYAFFDIHTEEGDFGVGVVKSQHPKV